MTVKTKSGLCFEFVKTSNKKILAVDNLLTNG
jgi:hypothetical protein